MKNKIVTMGEIMLRLSPQNNNRIIQAQSFDAYYGGAEANVAVALSNFGMDTYYVSQVPQNDIGKRAIRYLNENGVDTSHVILKGDRLGIYFLEKGVSIRPSKVIYDRDNSAISNVDEDDFDFDDIFKDAHLFHISGITPVLSKKCLNLTKKAIEVAKKYDIKISIDLNYRNKLCDYSEFASIMKDLIKDSYICFGWIEKDIKDDYKPFEYSKNINYEYFQKCFEYMHKELNVENVVTTLRENKSVSKNSLIAIGSNGEKIVTSKEYTFDILDRVGAGDSFAAGVLYKLINDKSIEEAINFGIASSVIKHTIPGDANIITNIDEIECMARNEGFNIQR
ncbi:2-dehydro-3-deoxygluconokinase [Clostridium botulinum]|uniref:2-dehydro-3-deoxygluconokinase n=2 Tax=Clostridium botulinum TaxID=1491 RepID=A0A9Q1UWP0_CLOBO|nr:sugar kinase [Clostridium botulinum]KEH99085.1 2-dehydro-3-deoxygluconokinase [Clostridium botulinum D str. 16868]KEI00366.1 2-dehydro-3-deoxygluconokinase [Clostridium botulinum C/D str. Sp77]KLU74845.1 2-dehydro-3-deoxygluconokinase [Clostridium botulinum V891]KOA72639.1 2-dehydro-3-deoxygluconokinase [Clostridium botulinum]KOA79718.1 2-dehydro-3-deoxygluconokinase [Clostridium botulinum]